MQRPELEKAFRVLLDKAYKDGSFYISGTFAPNCTKCVNWRESKDQCGKYNQRPPTSVIVTGCPEFELDEIPF